MTLPHIECDEAVEVLQIRQPVDVLHVRLRDSKIMDSEEVSPGIVADFDSDDNLVGVKILCLKETTVDHLRSISYQFDTCDRQALGEFFSKFAAALK